MNRRLPVVLLAGLIAAAAALLFALVVHRLPGVAVPVELPWPAWVAAFAAAERLVVHIQVRRDHHSFSLTDLVLAAGLFLLDPGDLVLAQLAGAALMLLLHRRQAGLKLAFNLAQFALSSSLAVVVFAALTAGRTWSDPATWLAAALAVAVSTLVAGACILAAMALSGEPVGAAELGQVLRTSLPFAVGVAAVGMLAAYTALQNPPALVLLVLPSVLLIVSYRAYTHARRQQEDLRLLHETTSLLYDSDDPATGLASFLTAVRGGFRADLAELVLLGDAEDAATVSRSREGQTPVALVPLADTAVEARLIEAALAVGEPTVRTGTGAGARLDSYAVQRGLKDAMVAVLRTEERVHGTLVVGDRSGDVSTFTEHDLALLRTFARHLATSLERGRLENHLRQVTALKEELRHQAMHDGLTGLPNRTLFLDRAEHALRLAARSGLWPAVLYIDLDGFKPINDRFGHEAGDMVLRAFGERLQGCVRAADTAARLGGDEFAVLLHGPIDRSGVEQVLIRIRSALACPVDVGGGRTGTVGASIGVAIAHEDTEVDVLLRNADTAMYEAKRRGGDSTVLFGEVLLERAPVDR